MWRCRHDHACKRAQATQRDIIAKRICLFHGVGIESVFCTHTISRPTQRFLFESLCTLLGVSHLQHKDMSSNYVKTPPMRLHTFFIFVKCFVPM